MNKLHNTLFILLVLILITLTGCEKKTSELHSKSPDGSTHITVYGTKTFMEPWDLTIEIKANKKSDELKTQLYADEINSKNIIFNWQDNRTCIITLIATMIPKEHLK